MLRSQCYIVVLTRVFAVFFLWPKDGGCRRAKIASVCIGETFEATEECRALACSVSFPGVSFPGIFPILSVLDLNQIPCMLVVVRAGESWFSQVYRKADGGETGPHPGKSLFSLRSFQPANVDLNSLPCSTPTKVLFFCGFTISLRFLCFFWSVEGCYLYTAYGRGKTIKEQQKTMKELYGDRLQPAASWHSRN